MSGQGLLAGQRIVVTGAASGIGRAGIGQLAAEGARVAGLDVDGDGLDAAIREVAAGVDADTIVGFETDVRDEASLDRAMKAVTEHFGGVDALWVNAGVTPRIAQITDWPVDHARDLLSVNVLGAWLTVRAALPVLRTTSAQSPTIVFTGSVSGRKGRPRLSAYQMCKGAIEQLVRALAVELGPEGIRVNSVAPGPVETPLLQSMLEGSGGDEYYGDLVSSIPLGRLSTPEEVGRAVAYLLSPSSAPITGASLPVDGGLLA